MPPVTICNLSEETHRALKLRAARHNRSIEAEVRAILDAAARPEPRLHLGTALADLGRAADVTDADVDAILAVRDRRPVDPWPESYPYAPQ